MEEWRPISGFPQYAVSNLGRVKRVVASAKGHPVGNFLKAWLTREGYAIVTLSSDDGAKRKQISRLVCEAFHGAPPSSDHQAAHNDGNPRNNDASNLRWATRSQNMADCIIHGTIATGKRHGRHTKPHLTPRGESHGAAKLTEEDVRIIRASDPRKISGAYLARNLGVSASLICRIRKNKAWRHI